MMGIGKGGEEFEGLKSTGRQRLPSVDVWSEGGRSAGNFELCSDTWVVSKY